MAAQDVEVLPEGVPGFIAARNTADHVLVSTDPEILADVGEIALNWMDLALYGSAAARDAVTGNPCEGCEEGLWSTTHRHLDALPVA